MARRTQDGFDLLSGGGGGGGNGVGGFSSMNNNNNNNSVNHPHQPNYNNHNHQYLHQRRSIPSSDFVFQNPYLETLPTHHHHQAAAAAAASIDNFNFENAFQRLTLSPINGVGVGVGVTPFHRQLLQQSHVPPTSPSVFHPVMDDDLGGPFDDPSSVFIPPDQYYPALLQQYQQYQLAQNNQHKLFRLSEDFMRETVRLEGLGLTNNRSSLNPTTTDSTTLNDQQWRNFNGGGGGGEGGVMVGCECGKSMCSSYDSKNDYCFPQPRQQQTLGSPDLFRLRSCSNVNGGGFRHDSVANHRGRSVDRSALEIDRLNRTQTYNRQRLQQQQQQHHQHQQRLYTTLERGRIVEMAQDQNGCRFLQKYFEEEKAEEIEIIFSEVKEEIGKLMVDPFGNYLVQKLFDVCNEDQIFQILRQLTQNDYELVHISLDLHGTRSVQKLLDRITTPQQIAQIMTVLGAGAVLLTKDASGHHVIQCCLSKFTNEENQNLLNAIADHCLDIATDRSGCCVLQLCVEHSRGEARERLVSEITANSLVLAQDPYGNYVVQYLLQQKVHHITEDVMRQLRGSFVSLSMQKFSSNVVQRCLNESGKEHATEIIRELIDSPNVQMLFQDQFANYVVQTALEVSKAREHIFNAICDLIRIHQQSLRSHPFGKRVLSKMNELTRMNELTLRGSYINKHVHVEKR